MSKTGKCWRNYFRQQFAWLSEQVKKDFLQRNGKVVIE